MSDYKERQENEIFTKVLKAGRRTYFFDVRETKAGDYYLTITESKKEFLRKWRSKLRETQNLPLQRRFQKFFRIIQ